MILKVIALCTLFAAPLAYTQNPASSGGNKALVTFYSSGKTLMWKTGSEASFVGRIFDDQQQLAYLHGDRFVTFAFDPGVHVLSTNWWTKSNPKGGSHLRLTLLPDHHYYIRTAFKSTSFFGGTEVLVNEVTCEDAQKANFAAKPLEPKHLHPGGRGAVIPATSFPACPKD